MFRFIGIEGKSMLDWFSVAMHGNAKNFGEKPKSYHEKLYANDICHNEPFCKTVNSLLFQLDLPLTLSINLKLTLRMTTKL